MAENKLVMINLECWLQFETRVVDDMNKSKIRCCVPIKSILTVIECPYKNEHNEPVCLLVLDFDMDISLPAKDGSKIYIISTYDEIMDVIAEYFEQPADVENEKKNKPLDLDRYSQAIERQSKP